jgi:hypothetical protein
MHVHYEHVYALAPISPRIELDYICKNARINCLLHPIQYHILNSSMSIRQRATEPRVQGSPKQTMSGSHSTFSKVTDYALFSVQPFKLIPST